MKLERILIIIVMGLGSHVCPAQVWDSAMAGMVEHRIRESMQFSMTVSNKIMVVGSTNFVHCRIQNISSNRIVFDNISHPAALPVIPGIRLEGVNVTRSGWSLPEQSKTLESHFLDAGKEYEWDESVVIGNDFKPGHYELGIWKLFSIPALNIKSEARSTFQDIEFTK